ncbi:hypothetical protein KR200_010394, partial [Drosophila serrata]
IRMLVRLPLLVLALLAQLLGSNHAQKDAEFAVRTRTPRATVTVDFGLLLRNLLLKSAQLSSAKANLVRTTRRPPPAMTTTTPAPPPPPPPNPRRRRPIWHPYFASGYLPFDYDYADPAVPPPPAPPPPAPQPTRRVRPQPRPLGLYNAQRPAARPPPPAPPAPPGPPSYDYDYDYDAPAAPAPATAPPPPPPPPPPAAAPRPRLRPRPQQPQQQPQQPDPRQRRPAQLGDRLVYQYAQPTGKISKLLTNCRITASGDGADAADTDTDSGAGAGAGASSTADGNADAQPERSPPRFLVNYQSDDDFFAGGTGPGSSVRDGSPPPSQQADSIPGPASGYGFPPTLDFVGLNRFPTPSHQQQQYIFK